MLILFISSLLGLTLARTKRTDRLQHQTPHPDKNYIRHAAHAVVELKHEYLMDMEGLWIDHPDSPKIIKEASIPDDIKQMALEFIENGYTIVRNSINSSHCDQAVQAFAAWCKSNNKECESKRNTKGFLGRTTNAHSSIPEFLNLMLESRKALQLQDFLFDAKTSIYTSLYFEQGTQQPIHVDIPFFWTVPKSRYFGYWIALEDVDENNGPLVVLKGGHKCSILAKRETCHPLVIKKKKAGPLIDTDNELFYAYANATLDHCYSMGLKDYEKLHIKKGDIIIWHPLLPHGGSTVKDKTRSRHSIVAHTVPEMTPVYHSNRFFDSTIPTSNIPTWHYDVVFDQSGLQEHRLVAKGDSFRTHTVTIGVY